MKHKEKRDLYRSGKSDEPDDDKLTQQKNNHIKKGKITEQTKSKKEK